MIGARFLWDGCGGIIVETEAYRSEGDPACHTFFRKKARAFVAEHQAGTAYVYLNYGMHWLLNFLTLNPENGVTGFVLVRALRPTYGIECMKKRRARHDLRELCSGPAKLTQALGIGGGEHGCRILESARSRFQLPEGLVEVRADARIGISQARDFPWRFTAAADGKWISRRVRAAS